MAGKRIKYTPELADKFCAAIAEGNSVLQVSKMKGMPKERTVYAWFELHEDFLQKYMRAREARADKMFEEMLEIADDGSNDWMEKRDAEGEDTGLYTINGEHVQRSRLRLDTRKWMLARMSPRKYSERMILSGDDENPIKTVTEVKLGFVRSGSEPSDT